MHTFSIFPYYVQYFIDYTFIYCMYTHTHVLSHHHHSSCYPLISQCLKYLHTYMHWIHWTLACTLDTKLNDYLYLCIVRTIPQFTTLKTSQLTTEHDTQFHNTFWIRKHLLPFVRVDTLK